MTVMSLFHRLTPTTLSKIKDKSKIVNDVFLDVFVDVFDDVFVDVFVKGKKYRQNIIVVSHKTFN
jgi:hypothetical protein